MQLINIVLFSIIGIVVAVTIIANLAPRDIEDAQPPEVSLVSVSEPVLLDPFGFPVSTIQVDDQVLVQSEITNNQDIKQPFVYVVQVKNSNGIIVSFSFARSELRANDTLKVAQSWIPDSPGKYEVEIFVWDSIEGQKVLAPTRQISVTAHRF